MKSGNAKLARGATQVVATRSSSQRVFQVAAVLGIAILSGCTSGNDDDSTTPTQTSSVIDAPADTQQDPLAEEVQESEDSEEPAESTETTEAVEVEPEDNEDDDATTTSETTTTTNNEEENRETTTTKATPDEATYDYLSSRLLLRPPDASGNNCEFVESETGVWIRRVDLAVGGDMFALCTSVPQGETPSAVTLSAPGGSPSWTIELERSDREVRYAPDSNAPGFALVGENSVGKRRFVGLVDPTRNSDSSDEIVQIAIFLPHNRPPGDWVVSFGSSTASVQVWQGCSQPTIAVPDPFFFDTGILTSLAAEFSEGETRRLTADDHCRIFPDLSGLEPSQAEDAIDSWASVLGLEPVISSEFLGCGPNGTVAVRGHQPNPGFPVWDLAGDLNVTLTIGVACPPVPDILNMSFDDVHPELERLAQQFPGWTYQTTNCTLGTGQTVTELLGAKPGDFTTFLRVVCQ